MSKKSMSIEEIARRLYKLHWADHQEWKQALYAAQKLSNEDWIEYREHVMKHYNIDISNR